MFQLVMLANHHGNFMKLYCRKLYFGFDASSLSPRPSPSGSLCLFGFLFALVTTSVFFLAVRIYSRSNPLFKL